MHLVNRDDKRTQCAPGGNERSERITNLQEQICTAERPAGRGPGMARVNLSGRAINKMRSPTVAFFSRRGSSSEAAPRNEGARVVG